MRVSGRSQETTEISQTIKNPNLVSPFKAFAVKDVGCHTLKTPYLGRGKLYRLV